MSAPPAAAAAAASTPAPKKGNENAASPSSSAASSASPVSNSATCPTCCNPFSSKEGPAYPRVVIPCAHTFCTSCIEAHIKAKGPARFCCLLHNGLPLPEVKSAANLKANFALIELLEMIEKDVEHQKVDEHLTPPKCEAPGCSQPAAWYCKNDDACLCEAHRQQTHQGVFAAKHTVVPVQQRFECAGAPKCPSHKTKDLDMWCSSCEELCCYMCAQFGSHVKHQLAPVEDVAKKAREEITGLSRSATEGTTKFDQEAGKILKQIEGQSAQLITMQRCPQDKSCLNMFNADAASIPAQLSELESVVIGAIAAKVGTLQQSLQAETAAGKKSFDLRMEDLVTCRSQYQAVVEESKRVLRMNDHGVLGHLKSVKTHLNRAHDAQKQYDQNCDIPIKLSLLSQHDLVLDEINVCAFIDVTSKQLRSGTEVVEDATELPRSVARDQLQTNLALLQTDLALLTRRDAMHEGERESLLNELKHLKESVRALQESRDSVEVHCCVCHENWPQTSWNSQCNRAASWSPKVHTWQPGKKCTQVCRPQVHSRTHPAHPFRGDDLWSY